MRTSLGTADTHSRFVYVVAAISALGGLLFGYDTGVISGAILFIKQEFALSPTTEEITVAAVLIGAVAGAAFGGPVADRLGRRRTIIIAAGIFTAGALGTALTPSIGWLIAGRIVVGVAIAVASFTTPMYISEVAPPHVRGALVSFSQLAVTIGIVIAYLVDLAFAPIQGWRWMFGLAAIPGILLGSGMVFMPSSPRWLLSIGQTGRARAVLERIRAGGEIDDEIADIRHSLRQQSGRPSELLSPLVRPALIVGIGLALFQQVTGINTVIYYAPTIFQFAGLGSASVAILATVGVGLVNVCMTTVALLLLDRVGRRPLLLIGVAGMVLSLTVLGVAFYLSSLAGMVGWIAVGSLMIYVGSFAIGLGPIFWLLISEIYPLKIRGLAMSAATVANWGANLLVTVTFLSLIQIVGRSGTFWIYAIVGAGAWFFAYFLVPETKGRTFEQIEADWRAGRHPREMGR